MRSSYEQVSTLFHLIMATIHDERTQSVTVHSVNLSQVLQSPFEQHEIAAVDSGLSMGDVLDVFDQLPMLLTTEHLGLPAARNCILHAALFHLLGGYSAHLPPPPPTSSAARSPEFACTRTLYADTLRISARREKLQKQAHKGSLAAAEELTSMRAERLTSSNCCLLRSEKSASDHAAATPLRASTAPPAPLPLPPPPALDERVLLHRHLLQEREEKLGLVEERDALGVLKDDMERQRNEAERHMLSAQAQLKAERELFRAECSKHDDEMRELERACAKSLQQEQGAAREAIAATSRSHQKAVNQLNFNWERRLRMQEEETVERLRAQDEEVRGEKQRLFEERQEAIAKAKADKEKLQKELEEVKKKCERQLEKAERMVVDAKSACGAAVEAREAAWAEQAAAKEDRRLALQRAAAVEAACKADKENARSHIKEQYETKYEEQRKGLNKARERARNVEEALEKANRKVQRLETKMECLLEESAEEDSDSEDEEANGDEEGAMVKLPFQLQPRRDERGRFQCEADEVRALKWAQLARDVSASTVSMNLQDMFPLLAPDFTVPPDLIRRYPPTRRRFRSAIADHQRSAQAQQGNTGGAGGDDTRRVLLAAERAATRGARAGSAA